MFEYVPYTALSHVARLKAAQGEEDFVINGLGGLTAKGLDRKTERQIQMVDWQAAAHVAEDRIRAHHGDERAEALAAHHRIVTDLAHLHGWRTAVEYDIQQRELVAFRPAHDLSTLDSMALTLIAT